MNEASDSSLLNVAYGAKNVYILKGDISTLSKMRASSRRGRLMLQQQETIMTVDLERQHNEKRKFSGPLHLDLHVYFISNLPMSLQRKSNRLYSTDWNVSKPHLSSLISFVERIGEGILFENGTYIASVRCVKSYTDGEEPFLKFKIEELKQKEGSK